MKLKDLVEKHGEYEIENEKLILKFLEKPKPKTVWDLKDGDNLYVLETGGFVGQSTWFDIHLKEARKGGNAFLTIEEAEKELKRRECEALLKKHANGYEFRPGCNNWFIYCDMGDDGDCRIDFDAETRFKFGTLYFEFLPDACKAVKSIGEERLIRDYFQIENKN